MYKIVTILYDTVDADRRRRNSEAAAEAPVNGDVVAVAITHCL